MPILSRIGRKSPKHISVRLGIYFLLTAGALSIIYPMLIVIGQTMSNRFDLRDNAIIPYYLRNRNELLLKHIYSISRRVDLLAARHHREKWKNQTSMREDRKYYDTMPDIIRKQGFNIEAQDAILEDFSDFKASLPPDRVFVKSFRIEDYYRPFLKNRYGEKADALRKAMKQGGPVPSWLIKTYPEKKEREQILEDRSRLALAVMNNELNTSYLNFYSVETGREGNWPAPFWRIGKKPKDRLWYAFKQTVSSEQRVVIPADAYWQFFLKMKFRTVDNLNAQWKTDYGSILEMRFPFREPSNPAMAETWKGFLTERWPRRLMNITGDYSGLWQSYVRKQLLKKFSEHENPQKRALEEISRITGRTIQTWEEFAFPDSMPENDTLARYWCEFTTSGTVRVSDMNVISPLLSFREFLRSRYAEDGGIDALNRKWKTKFTSFSDILLPIDLSVYVPVRFHPWKLRWSFMTESYKRVAEYIFGKGRAAQNTLILVILSLISALTINPIAAYSLSRFPMKHSTKILIFFLATMAFPPEVAMIPNFLLLRDLGFLNTFAALIFPRMANGFSIFLLKGFFDSLPRELYEAAEIDGASEVQVFRLVAMPLVKPLLAFIGLNTFVLAYSSFMWAFVICPNQKMWTLMVWVYDFQTKNAGNNYVMAATVLVCIPPLIVFLFVNRIIMRGIVIPSLK